MLERKSQEKLKNLDKLLKDIHNLLIVNFKLNLIKTLIIK